MQPVDHYAVIYVPQGRCGRIDRSACNDRVGSLFTDGIGSCQIVSLIGKGRVSLLHIDSVFNLSSLESECDWIGASATAVILFRQNYPTGDILRIGIKACLDKKKVKTLDAFIDPDQDGVQLWANPDASRTCHLHLTAHKMNQKPDHLWRHPKEILFITAQKMEQFLTIGYDTPLKKTVIFDGERWQRIPDGELVPYCPTDKEKGYLKQLVQCKGQRTENLISVLILIITEIQKSKKAILSDIPLKFAITVMEYVDNYISGFDHTGSFKRKMGDCLNDLPNYSQSKKYTLTQKDQDKVKQIIAALDLKDPYPVVKRLVEQYNKEGNFASNHLSTEFSVYEKHYLTGQMYVQHALSHAEGRKKAVELSKEGNIYFQKENFDSAVDCFKQALFLAQEHYTEGEDAFSKFYNNYGVALQRVGQKEEGDKLLQIGQNLKSNKV